MNPVRMEAQVVRDSLLHLAGELDCSMGGPPLPVAGDSRRRSLYFVHSHNEHHKFLAVFDDANVLECYRRAESIVPQQALALSNSKLALSMADKIAADLGRQRGRAGWRVRASGFRDDPRRPADHFRTGSLRGSAGPLDGARQRTAASGPGGSGSGAASLVHVLLNHNDFITIR